MHKYVNLGSRSYNPNVMWPTLIEKCYKKLRMHTKNDVLPNSVMKCIHTIYGIDAELIPITNKNYIKENIALALGHLIQDGKVGFMSIGHNQQKKVYAGRLYTLEEVKEEPILK